MTRNRLAIAAGAGVVALLGASVAFAAGSVACQTWNPGKISPPVTHCLAWTRDAVIRMRAANCDPSMMGDAAMRAECLAMMRGHQGAAPNTNG